MKRLSPLLLLLTSCLVTVEVKDSKTLQDGKFFLCQFKDSGQVMKCSPMAQDFYPAQVGMPDAGQ